MTPKDVTRRLFVAAGCLGLVVVVLAGRDLDANRDNAPRLANTAPLPNPFHVELTGSDRRWHVRYPDLAVSIAGPLATEPLSEICVPAGRRIVFVLKSTDFLYTFEIPRRSLKEIAAPELEFQLALPSLPPGRLKFVGEPMCSDPHTLMEGDIVVRPPDRFFDWLTSRHALAAPGEPAAAAARTEFPDA